MEKVDSNRAAQGAIEEIKNFSMIYVVIGLIASFYLIIMWILSSDNNARKELLKKDIGKHK